MKKLLFLLLALGLLTGILTASADSAVSAPVTAAETRSHPIIGLINGDISIGYPASMSGSVSGTSVKLSWPKAKRVTGYLVVEWFSSTRSVPVASTKKTSVTLKNVKKGTHTYLVYGYRSSPDAWVSMDYAYTRVTVNSIPSITAPEDVIVRQTGDTQVLVSWRAPDYAKSYIVYRSAKKSSDFKKVATVKAQSFTDTVPKAGKTYYYKVVAKGKINGKTSSKAAKVKRVKVASDFSAPSRPTYRALLIGNTYPGTEDALKGPDTDARGIAAMLKTMTGTPYSVKTCINVTADEILSRISTVFAGATENDVSLFYYAGHGLESDDADNGSLCGTTGTINPAQLRAALDKIPGKKVVLLDSCFSGAHIKGMDRGASLDAFNSAFIRAFAGQARSADNLADSGYYVITAASHTESSLSVGTRNGQFIGLMSSILMYGSGYNEMLKSYVGSYPADTNKDGVFTIAEVGKYVKNWVDKYRNAEQHTQYYFSDGAGSLPVWQR